MPHLRFKGVGRFGRFLGPGQDCETSCKQELLPRFPAHAIILGAGEGDPRAQDARFGAEDREGRPRHPHRE
ncbi:hypothetical protein WDW37_02610 [Bdellovibrionota bacterium FG-1]